MQLLARFGFAYFAGLVAAALFCELSLFAGYAFFALILAATVGFSIRALRGSRTFWCVLLAVTAAFTAFFLFTGLVYGEAKHLDGKTTVIAGKVNDISFKNGYYRYELSLDAADDRPINSVGIVLYAREELGAGYGDEVVSSVTMNLSRYDNGRIFGDSYKSRGMYLTAFADENTVVLPARTHSIQDYFRQLRDVLAASILNQVPDEQASIVSGMLLGGTGTMDASLSQTFARAGIFHMFSVSGLHMTVVIQLILAALSMLRIRRRVCAVTCMAAVGAFMLLTGCTASVMRSGIMALLLLSGELFSRDSKGLNSLGIACLLLTVGAPYIAYDIGFLLSVSATLGILLLTRPISNGCCKALGIKSRLGNYIVSLFAVSVSATIGTLPIALYSFDTVSLVGLILNPLIEPYGTILLFAGMLTAILGLFPALGLLAGFCGAAAGWSASLVEKCAKLAEVLPFSFILSDFPFLKLWFIISAGLFLFYMILKKKKKLSMVWTVLASFALLCAMGAYNRYLTDHQTLVTAVSTNSGGGVILTSKGSTALYGCSDWNTADELTKQLSLAGVKDIEVYLQPSNSDTAKQITLELCRQFTVKQVISPPEKTMKAVVPTDLSQTGWSVVSGNSPLVYCSSEQGSCLILKELSDYSDVRLEAKPDMIIATTCKGDISPLPANRVVLLNQSEQLDWNDPAVTLMSTGVSKLML